MPVKAYASPFFSFQKIPAADRGTVFRQMPANGGNIYRFEGVKNGDARIQARCLKEFPLQSARSISSSFLLCAGSP